MPAIQIRMPKTKLAPKSAVTPKVAGRATAVAAKSTKGEPATQTASVPVLNAEERQKLIAQAAYFRAEKRGFAPGCELQDWIEAEVEVLRLIGRG